MKMITKIKIVLKGNVADRSLKETMKYLKKIKFLDIYL